MFNLPSPIMKVDLPLYTYSGLMVYMKRDDLIHPFVSGNKWRKLKYNLETALTENYEGILTFGGAFSNHLHASAYACNHFGLSMVAMVRGKHVDLDNPTLKDLKHMGVKIECLDFDSYKRKDEVEFLRQLTAQYPHHMIIPEGGKNDLGVKGISEMMKEVPDDFDQLFVSAGTGSTALGLAEASSIRARLNLHIIACVKDDSIRQRFEHFNNCQFHSEFTQGGFAKINHRLIKFLNGYKISTGISLDPIYNGKMMMAFHELIKRGAFKPREKILLVHTGGLQGVHGHNYRYKDRPELLINV